MPPSVTAHRLWNRRGVCQRVSNASMAGAALPLPPPATDTRRGPGGGVARRQFLREFRKRLCVDHGVGLERARHFAADARVWIAQRVDQPVDGGLLGPFTAVAVRLAPQSSGGLGNTATVPRKIALVLDSVLKKTARGVIGISGAKKQHSPSHPAWPVRGGLQPQVRLRLWDGETCSGLSSELAEGERRLLAHARAAVFQCGGEAIDRARVADLAEGERRLLAHARVAVFERNDERFNGVCRA